MPKTYDKQIQNRLKRSEGQIRGVLNMMEDGRDCQDLLVQLSAIRSSIDKAMGLIVTDNLACCLEDGQQDEAQQAKLQAALDLIIKSR